MTDFKTQIYLDGASEKEILEYDNDDINGFTFNPTLFKNLGIENYLSYSKKIVDLVKGKPISLEVTGDDEETILRQAHLLSELGENVSVKIPITFTSGIYTTNIIEKLTKQSVKLNITAIFTIEQVQEIIEPISDTECIISVFAGRLYDIGIDAKEKMQEMGEFIHKNSKCKILWASPRMSYDLIVANQVNCDIITVSIPLYKKLSILGKNPSEYSLETVKMFFNDAKRSGYSF